MENTDGQPEPIPNNLIINLKNWVNERPVHLQTQRNVRRNIANAVVTDILNPVGSSSVPQKLENYRLNVSNGLKTAIENLKSLEVDKSGELKLTLNFREQRYDERNVNPKILGESGFPTGTKVLFLNHCASLGVISWRGK